MYHIVAPILSHLGASEWRILAEYFGYTTKTVKTSDIARAIYNHNHKEAQRKLEAAADRMAECKAGGDYKGFYRALQAFRDAEDHYNAAEQYFRQYLADSITGHQEEGQT